jgi:hypothetical protein
MPLSPFFNSAGDKKSGVDPLFLSPEAAEMDAGLV